MSQGSIVLPQIYPCPGSGILTWFPFDWEKRKKKKKKKKKRDQKKKRKNKHNKIGINKINKKTYKKKERVQK